MNKLSALVGATPARLWILDTPAHADVVLLGTRYWKPEAHEPYELPHSLHVDLLHSWER